jgi:hypothetical protein
MKMIINGCPHDINVVRLDGSIETVYKTDLLVRVAVRTELLYVLKGIEYYGVEYGPVEIFLNGQRIESLPTEIMGKEIVVSGAALEALKREGNKDCRWLAPGELVRNEQGQPIGCRGFKT